MIINNLYPTATSDQLMPSVQPSTVIVQPSGQSNSSDTGDSDGLGSGGVAAIVTLICLLFLVILPAGVIAAAILLYKKGKVKDLRRKILKKKNRSFSIGEHNVITIVYALHLQEHFCIVQII